VLDFGEKAQLVSSKSTGLKQLAAARASLLSANNFSPLFGRYISRRVYEIIYIVFHFIINIWMLKHKPHGFI
jgi:hypothetical protein